MNMIWDKKKFKSGVQDIPPELFDQEMICPVCNKKIKDISKEKLNKRKSITYVRHFNKFYIVHKECFFIMYEGIKETIDDNVEEYIAYRL